MHILMQHIIYNFDIAGIVLLFVALVPTIKLMRELPPGQMRTRWKVLSVMIVFFIVSYLYITWQHRINTPQFGLEAVLVLLFFGAMFVLLVSALSLQTALDVKRIYALEIESITDSMMGIGNRRYLERKLNEEFAKARRYELPLSLLMLDIDHFKEINDTFGHDAGDIVLKNLGTLISRFIRESDYAARYGGEEIVIITPLTDGPHAAFIAERLRKKIEESVMIPADTEKGIAETRIAVSIGVASYASDMDSIEDLLKRVDMAMYRAKHEGRNRIFLCDGTTSNMVLPQDV
jgi:diguanylate cyclase (GGDEF)-like protein